MEGIVLSGGWYFGERKRVVRRHPWLVRKEKQRAVNRRKDVLQRQARKANRKKRR